MNQVITDLRLNSSELPTQEIEIDEKQTHYHRLDLNNLVDQAQNILARHREIPDKLADNNDITESVNLTKERK